MDEKILTPRMRELAQRLVAYEAVAHNSSGKDRRPAVRVCERFRRPLTTLAGPAAFRALLTRALTLAKAHAPGLNTVQVAADGSLQGLDKLSYDEAAEADVVIAAQLLVLLTNFIGQPLMMRLVLDAWPDLPFDDPNLGRQREHEPTR